MADILGIGISHWPRLRDVIGNYPMRIKASLKDPDIPDDAKDPANWPQAMREEWGDDEGSRSAPLHRDSCLAGIRAVRAALDDFKPDAIVIWGDDQFENFRDDVIPPFCVLAYQEDVIAKPFSGAPNPWGEDENTEFRIKVAPEISKALVSGLIESGFDMPYAYKPLHYPHLSHAFMNAILYLDYDRTGFPYPVIPCTVNCYGRHVVSHRGTVYKFGNRTVEWDPPSPSPARCFDVGAGIARVMKASPWRIALLASSSWSHAFLCDKNYHLHPDVESDRRLYEAMLAGDYRVWRETPLSAVEDSGQQELLNWFALMGAMDELGYRATWSTFSQTYIFNSNKVAAVFAGVS
jgi:hypothetical protein